MGKVATDIYAFSCLRKNGFTCVGKYALSTKHVMLIGNSFTSEKRTIVESLVEEAAERT